jgi:hypothetical protein
MDLFTPIVTPDKFHPNFASCIAVRNPHDEAVITEWADGLIDRDGKFVEEFQTTFNSSFWELYLHALLKEAGCKIDFSHHAPDFVVTDPTPFVVEATVALNAKEGLPEWTPLDLNLYPRDLNEFNRVAMVRLLNSISEKSKKYDKSYRNLPHVAGRPFVLALTPFDQPFFYLQVHRAIEAVLYGFYVDEQEHIDDPSKGVVIPAKTLKAVRKSDSVELPLGIFNDESHAHISAVIFNSSATWGKVRALNDDPYPFIYFFAARLDPRNNDCYVFRGIKADYAETLFDGLRVYHNPYATHPLDWRVFQKPGAFQALYTDPQTHTWEYWLDRPTLGARNLITLKVTDAKTIDHELLRQKMGDRPKGGWYKVPFSPALLEAIARNQLREDIPASPTEP